MTYPLHPFRNFVFLTLFVFLINPPTSFAQSILLIKAETKIYDTNKGERVVKLRVKDNTWVNYKGKQGNLIKISNYFGKDQEYPFGIYDGYVAIESVLDTAKREDYLDLLALGSPEVERFEHKPSPSPAIQTNSDIGAYYIGMSQVDARAVGQPSIDLGSYNYTIDLDFNTKGYLSELTMSGTHENALAVDTKIKDQISELNVLLNRKYGSPRNTFSYPSFLEIDAGDIFQVANWKVVGKAVSLGIAEKNDLYYTLVTVIQE